MIRVMIADDHAVVRQGLKQILLETSDITMTAEAHDGHEVMRLLRENMNIDVLLLDVAMPGLSGIDVLKRVHDERPQLPVLFLSIYPEDQYAVRLIKAGAVGYLTKESAPEQLVGAIRQVAAGRKAISPLVAELLAQTLTSTNDEQPHLTLSDREFEVMRLIGAGRTVSEIAAKLNLSVKTISTHRQHVLEKMGMKTNAELTYYAVKHQLVG